MKTLKKVILMTGCLLLLLSGCANTQDNVSASSENVQADISNAVSESNSDNQETDTSIVTGNDLVEFRTNKNTAIVIAGDLESNDYDRLLEMLTAICDERDYPLYKLDANDENNTEWLSENEVTADMNVIIMYNGHHAVIDMIEELYQSEMLSGIMDGIIDKIDTAF